MKLVESKNQNPNIKGTNSTTCTWWKSNLTKWNIVKGKVDKIIFVEMESWKKLFVETASWQNGVWWMGKLTK